MDVGSVGARSVSPQRPDHAAQTWVTRWPSCAPAELVQEHRALHKNEFAPVEVQLETYLKKEADSVFRKGPYKGKTVQEALQA